MIAIAWLIAHAVIGTAGPIATVEFLIFEQKLRGVNKSRVHLIIYRARRKDVIDTLPLTLVTIGASDTILSLSLFCKTQDAVLADLTESRTISTIVEITGNQNKCLGVHTLDGINRLT